MYRETINQIKESIRSIDTITLNEDKFSRIFKSKGIDVTSLSIYDENDIRLGICKFSVVMFTDKMKFIIHIKTNSLHYCLNDAAELNSLQILSIESKPLNK